MGPEDNLVAPLQFSPPPANIFMLQICLWNTKQPFPKHNSARVMKNKCYKEWGQK